MVDSSNLKAWVVTVDMGLGHQRATYPLRVIAEDGILVAGTSKTSDKEEKALWNNIRKSYELLSRVQSIPIIGKPLFSITDKLQEIVPFYPRRDLSRPTHQVKLIKRLLGERNCTRLMKIVRSKPLPMITSFMVPAIAADRDGFRSIYCIICDAEIARAWVSENPKKSRINYLVPCGRAKMRLKSYGVPEERIFMTGFPFPLELLGDNSLDILRNDVARRLFRLDPNNRFWPLHGLNVEHFLGEENCSKTQSSNTLTITYAIGGAGAQTKAGVQIARSLQKHILAGRIKLNIIAGVRNEVRDLFEKLKSEILPECPGLQVIYANNKPEYFRKFSQIIRTTDVLWTKPSELSFYCGLGLPIIIGPPLGSQERFNKKWLLEIQAGIPQQDPRYTDQWLLDLWHEGRLAETAWDGFLKARKCGTFKIFELLKTGTIESNDSPLKR